MSEEENKRITRDFIDGVNHNDKATLVGIVGEDYTFHNFQGTFHGADEFYEGLQVFFKAFPDMKLHLEDQVADGDKVVNRVRMTGTHEGEFAGIPPTGKDISTSAMAMYTLKDGKILELWAQWDVVGIFNQMGAKPMRPQDC